MRPSERMTVDQFLDWADIQEQGRFELLDGEVFAMSPERISHNETKQLRLAGAAQCDSIARPAL